MPSKSLCSLSRMLLLQTATGPDGTELRHDRLFFFSSPLAVGSKTREGPKYGNSHSRPTTACLGSMMFALAASARSLSPWAPQSPGLEFSHATTDVGLRVGWVGRRPGFKGRALLIERQWKEKKYPHTPSFSPGDAGEVSYYNLEKQTPVKSCFFLRRKGGRCGPKGSCTRPSSMQGPGRKRDHTIGHHQQAAYCF